MNFKQNSLFTRNTGYEEEPMESQGGVLAVWGSPSSGKTVVSVKLADYLARKSRCPVSVRPPIWKGKNPLGAFLLQPM